MASTDLPAVIIVHGGFHTPFHYTKLVKSLEGLGFETHCPQLPTSSGWCGMTTADDVATLRREIDSLVSSGRHVVLLAHSYGGVPASNASRGFSLREYQAQGLSGGLVHVIYMCAYMLAIGDSLQSIMATDKVSSDHASQAALHEDGTFLCPDARKLFYPSLAPERAEELAEKLNRFCAQAAVGPCEWHPWLLLPVTFLHCERDPVLPLVLQEKLVEDARATGASISTESFDSDHSAFESIPDDIAKAVLRACERSKEAKF